MMVIKINLHSASLKLATRHIGR